MKFLNIKNLATYLSTFLNILKIYFITNKKLRNNNKSKFIFFYFPVKAYYRNIIEIKKALHKNKNLDIYLLFNRNSSEIIKNYKDSYFLDINYLKYIPFSNIILKKVNIFISSYVTYVFPPNSKYIYMS